jgi:predicted small metal-binding protein
MKTQLNCPCGLLVTGNDEDELVENVQRHLAEEHPDRDYSRDEILFLAT